MGYVLPLSFQYFSSGDPLSQNVFVCLFLLISRGLSALGPVTAGDPDANATITVIPTAKLPHKRRKSKGFLLGSMALKDWL